MFFIWPGKEGVFIPCGLIINDDAYFVMRFDIFGFIVPRMGLRRFKTVQIEK